MSRHRRHSLGWPAAVAAALIAAYTATQAMRPATQASRGAPPAATGALPAAPAPAPEGTRTCVRVIDGDTVVLDGGERVRLIGVDTPETVDPRRPVQRFGREASAFTHRMAEHRRVRLEYGTERRDRHGRTLAYVFLEDGTLLNAEIVRQGYGHATTRFPFARMEEFRALEAEAREAGRGLWAEVKAAR